VEVAVSDRPDPHDSLLRYEREILKAFLQGPSHLVMDLLPDVFTNSIYREVFQVIQKASGDILDHARSATAGTPLEAMVMELAVEPVRAPENDFEGYVNEMSNRLWDRDAEAKILNLKVQLANAKPEEHGDLFDKIVTLEKFRKTLKQG
jgi:hypothetical protein